MIISRIVFGTYLRIEIPIQSMTWKTNAGYNRNKGIYQSMKFQVNTGLPVHQVISPQVFPLQFKRRIKLNMNSNPMKSGLENLAQLTGLHSIIK